MKFDINDIFDNLDNLDNLDILDIGKILTLNIFDSLIFETVAIF